MYKPYAFVLVVTLLSPGTAQSSDDVFTASNSKWRAECASCHIAYPARMLPAESWKRLMTGLDKHFGTDASMDPTSTVEILAYLEKNANPHTPEPATQPVLRITETRWFQTEHDEVPARLWKHADVKSPSNCAACHTRAETGDFRERYIRLPK